MNTKLKNLRRRVNRVGTSPKNTCPYGRHLELMADTLASGQTYNMFEDDPEHCAESIYTVLESLYKLRAGANKTDDRSGI